MVMPLSMTANTTPDRARLIDLCGAVVLGLLVLLLAYFILYPGIHQMRQLAREQALLAEEVTVLGNWNVTVLDAERQLEAMAAQREALDEQLPARIQFSEFYAAVADHAQSLRVDLRRVQPQASRQEAGYLFLPVEIDADGAFQSLYALLYNVGHMKRLVKIQHVELTATDDPGVCHMRLSVRLYAAAPEPPA